jgi:hypothetical protein
MLKKLTYVLICLGLCLGLSLSVSSAEGPRNIPSQYFPHTGHYVIGGFLDFFNRHGGLDVFGYPITDEFSEGGMTVQYFERARFEWHPGNPWPYQVQLGLLGTQIHSGIDPPMPNPGWRWDRRYFPQTGHVVCGPFLGLWERYGLDVFGYPITEAIAHQDGVVIQYFQRARMELHPWESWPRLGNLGSEWLSRQPQPSYFPPPCPYRPPSVRSRHFPETGYTVIGGFLDFWENRGGLDIFGYPISNEFQEGNLTVQYFQRARFEWHPENPPNYRVQLGLLGQQVYRRIDPPVPDWTTPWYPSQRYFHETGHVVSNAFLEFFDRHGGPDIFGYPISEAMYEETLIVQYFQRARMEWHPENNPHKVQLGLLGSQVYGP